MKLKIHRGTKEIGGSCVELKSQGKSLLLDIGTPLVNPDGTSFDDDSLKRPLNELLKDNLLPSIPGLYDNGNCDIAGVILSHAHLDHYGLTHHIRSDIPVYATEGTKALINVSKIFITNSPEVKNLVTFPQRWEPVQIGPFTVTTYPVDHSAPDAIAIEVEADGKKIFYSGDLRGHGRKKRLFDHLLKKPPEKIDLLLMEGSSLGRNSTEHSFPDEDSVTDGIIEVIKNKENLALMFCSSQNIDRIVSAYKAVRKTRGILVFDLYTAYILHKLKPLSANLPQYDNCDRIRIKFWHHQKEALEKAGQNDFVKKVIFSKKGIKKEEIIKRRKEILMLAKANSLLPKLIRKLDTTDDIKVIWSMWSGYINGNDQFSRFCEKFNLKPKMIHTSGHASIEYLQRLEQAIQPAHTIPIHTFHPDQYKKLFQSVIELADGEEITL